MKRLILICLIIMCGCVNLGYATWNFSNRNNTNPQINVNINNFVFKEDRDKWTDYDKLDSNSYEYSKTLRDALNETDSEKGTALAKAIAARKSKDFIGNMDTISNVANNLENVLNVEYTCKYIIKIHSDDFYELYVTYENLNNKKIYERFGVVYKTTFKRDENGEFQAIQSYSGTATITYYDAQHGQYQRSFNTDEFI